MTITAAIVSFAVIWWMVFFMALPFGVKKPDDVEEGMEPGAPEQPRLWLKAGVTTLISIVLFGIWWWVLESGIFTIQRSLEY